MVGRVASGLGTSARMGGSMESQGSISMLLSKIKGLRKNLRLMQKQLMETTDPAERKVLLKMIQDVQEMMAMFEAQIRQIQQADQRREAHQQEANRKRREPGPDDSFEPYQP